MAAPKRNWRRFLPNIEFQLHIPLVHIGTLLLYERLDTRTIEVILLRVHVIKWSHEFRLYWKEGR